MKAVAIVQARMASTRLPGKVMADVVGKPLLYHVVKRAQQARTLGLVAVATTDRPADDRIAQYCAEIGVPCFRGNEEDVLDRYYHAAKHFGATVIVRLTADCPFLDPVIVDKVVRVFASGAYDFVSNTHPPTYPDGLDTEVFRWEALERSWREARLRSEREHVTAYMWKHPELFRLANVENDVDLSALRWTVDEPQVLEFVRRAYSHLGVTPCFGLAEVLVLLREHPELAAVNVGIERNEGYQKSLREDTLVTPLEVK